MNNNYSVNTKNLPVIFSYIKKSKGIELNTNEECQAELTEFIDNFITKFGLNMAVESGLLINADADYEVGDTVAFNVPATH